MQYYKKILSLLVSIGMIALGIHLSLSTNRLWYGLVLAGIAYSIYEIYSIATYKRKTLEQKETQRKLDEQKTFDNVSPLKNAIQADITVTNEDNAEHATIIVHWFKEKMGLGSMLVHVNGIEVGVIKKNNLQVTYHTNVPFNVIHIGIYKAEIKLSPGDTVEYFIAGNGIRHDRTILTTPHGV